ncbi:hypothetical protein HNP84_009689 [Thermocatellispora tengchongensis]|uniref:Uncharacterized protein n=1 Tax=Thermocatellispora tengchongensis TaxID=1073253 RepID=A0A840PVL1_9ACTN|nr:hypothetical protein [Thermocatellispora tengchongensis]
MSPIAAELVTAGRGNGPGAAAPGVRGRRGASEIRHRTPGAKPAQHPAAVPMAPEARLRCAGRAPPDTPEGARSGGQARPRPPGTCAPGHGLAPPGHGLAPPGHGLAPPGHGLGVPCAPGRGPRGPVAPRRGVARRRRRHIPEVPPSRAPKCGQQPRPQCRKGATRGCVAWERSLDAKAGQGAGRPLGRPGCPPGGNGCGKGGRRPGLWAGQARERIRPGSGSGPETGQAQERDRPGDGTDPGTGQTGDGTDPGTGQTRERDRPRNGCGEGGGPGLWVGQARGWRFTRRASRPGPRLWPCVPTPPGRSSHRSA